MDVIGVPTEAQIKRMQGIIAMLQGDKKTLVQRTDHLEEQNTLLQTTINKLAKQAEDATNKLELLTTENNNLVNELQVNIIQYFSWVPMEIGRLIPSFFCGHNFNL